MCDNAISKQIRHILSHNFPLVQFIPVMLSCVGYTSTFCFMVLLFFTFFLGFLHDQTLNVSLHIIITQGRQILFLFFSEELSNQCSHPFSMPGIFIYLYIIIFIHVQCLSYGMIILDFRSLILR